MDGTHTPLVIGFPDYARQGQALAQALGVTYAQAELHRFPDGESRLRLPDPLPHTVILCRSLDRPNDKLVELLLAANTARGLGAQRLILVAPYLCYMRQDIAFRPGEAVSQRIVGRFLAELFDEVVTVDPHLHRIERLEQAVPARRAVALSAAPLMANFLARRLDRPLLLGPDAESTQWVAAIAAPQGLQCAIAAKQRHGDRDVRITLPADLDVRGQEVVLVDDVISSGHTMAETARLLRAGGAASIYALVTHALFADGATAALRAAGIETLWSSDSISHPSNALPLADLLAAALSDCRPAAAEA